MLKVRITARRAALLVAACAFAGESRAQRAPYATEQDLPGDGVRHLLDVAALGAYAPVFEPSRVSGLANVGFFALRSRLEVGHAAAYCLGFDGEIGGSDRGVDYGVTAYPIGIGTIWGDGNTVSLCGGAGLNRIGSAVPLGARFPAEISAAFNLGPVRPTLWIRPSFVAGADARKDGSSLPIFDELELGLLVRLSPEHRYWTTTHAGGGLAVGVAYYEFMHTRYLAATVGFDFSGGR